MAKTKLPKFKGKLLIEIPKVIPQVDFLRGDFGKAFLEEYQERVRDDYNNNSVLNVLNYEDGIVKGSNPYAVVLANQILKQEGLRTATQADLEMILKINALDLRGVYVDTGLVLRSENEPNKSLAKYLVNQEKKKGYEHTKNPLVIWLNQLNLENNKNSPKGLRFKLSENCETFYSPTLKKNGEFSLDDIDEKTGLPKKISSGNRYLYTRDSGLSRLCLDRGSSLFSIEGNLLHSNANGRMVVVKE